MSSIANDVLVIKPSAYHNIGGIKQAPPSTHCKLYQFYKNIKALWDCYTTSEVKIM